MAQSGAPAYRHVAFGRATLGFVNWITISLTHCGAPERLTVRPELKCNGEFADLKACRAFPDA